MVTQVMEPTMVKDLEEVARRVEKAVRANEDPNPSDLAIVLGIQTLEQAVLRSAEELGVPAFIIAMTARTMLVGLEEDDDCYYVSVYNREGERAQTAKMGKVVEYREPGTPGLASKGMVDYSKKGASDVRG